jgi:hypothetical protein
MHYVLFDHPNISEKKQAYKFPNVAAEVLSTPNAKVLEYFMAADDNGRLVNFETLFSVFFDKEGSPLEEFEVNFTRAGYLQKIINSLINNRPATFAVYLLQSKKLVAALKSHSYSKSLCFVLQNILVISTQTANGNNANANSANQKTDGANGQSPDVDFAKETLDGRLELFDEILKLSIETSHLESQTDKHSNLSSVVMFMLSKEFPERTIFIKKFIENLDLLIYKFAATYADPGNNKLGNVFLIFLENFWKEDDKEMAALDFKPSRLEKYATLFFELMHSNREQTPKLLNRSQRTLSFSAEVLPANLKLYKVLEALLIMTKVFAGSPEFNCQIFSNSGFEKIAMRMMLEHPFNNILHNQIKRFLVIIIEGKSEALHDKFFTQNPAFDSFLTTFLEERRHSKGKKKSLKQGYVGPLMAVVSTILKHESLASKLSNNKAWNQFMTEFYDEQNHLENFVLGDVDTKLDQSDQSTADFYFSLEEIKAKYAAFLDLFDEPEPHETEDHPISSEEKLNEGAESQGIPTHSEQTESAEAGDLLQEIKDLDEHNPEAAYVDFNYWRPMIEYSVDDLLNEMKN